MGAYGDIFIYITRLTHTWQQVSEYFLWGPEHIALHGFVSAPPLPSGP